MINFIVVGCGGLGSFFSHQIALKSIEDETIGEIILVDSDSLEEKNLPYILGKKFIKHYIGIPKAIVLADVLSSINQNLQSIPLFGKYPEETNHLQFENYLSIDCRDSPDESSKFNYKFGLDGHFGSMVVNPRDIKQKKQSRYTIAYSRFSASLFSSICCNWVLNQEHKKFDKRARFIINLEHCTPEVNYVRENNILRRSG